MAFDIAGARRAGYSDAEIAEFLGTQRRFDVTGARREGYSDAEILDHLVKSDVKPSAGIGTPMQFLRGLVPGGVGLVEQAAIGASSVLPERAEQAVRPYIKSAAETLRAPFAEAPGKEDTIARRLGESVGSVGAMIPLAAMGPLGLAGAAGLGVAAGAGEARTRAEAGGATEAERAQATALGAGVGATELLPIARFLRRLGTGGTGVVSTLRRALVTGGEEGVQEAAANIAQNLIERGIYNPEKGVFTDTGEALGYGAGTGALVSALADVVLGGRRRGAAPAPAAPEAAAAAPTAPTAPTAPEPSAAPVQGEFPETALAPEEQQQLEQRRLEQQAAVSETAPVEEEPIPAGEQLELPGITPVSQIVTPEILAEVGLPVEPKTPQQKGVAGWMQENVVGKSFDEVQSLVESTPDLTKGRGLRARILRDLTAKAPAPFEGEQIERPAEPVEPVTGGREPSVAVPSGTGAVGVEPATPGPLEAPVAGGVETAERPVAPGVEPEGAQYAAIAQPPTVTAQALQPFIAPERATPQAEKALTRYAARMGADKAAPADLPRYMGWDLMNGSTIDPQTGEFTKIDLRPGKDSGITTPQARAAFEALNPQAQQQVLQEARNYVAQEAQAETARERMDRQQQMQAPEAVDLAGLEEDYGLDILAERAGRRPTVTETPTGRRVQGTRYQEEAPAGVPLSPSIIEELEGNNLTAALYQLAQTTQNPQYKQLALRLVRLLGKTQVTLSNDLRNDENQPAAGAASRDGLRIWLDRTRGFNEETLLHESVHAASEQIIDTTPAQRTPQQNAAVKELTDLWNASKADPDITLGPDARALLSEFVTEALTNPTLVEQLQAKPWTLRNAWESFKKTLLKMLGVTYPTNMREAAIAAMDTVFITPDKRGGATTSARREISPIGFYSALADQIKQLPSNAQPAAGWKNAIKGLVNKGAVKQDEVGWSGINEWLDMQQGRVPREAVTGYLKQGGVRVEETVPKTPKYAQYTLPGGENYREVRLTLPRKEVTTGDVAQRLFGMPMAWLSEDERGQVAEEMRRMFDSRARDYTSPHWDQPNVLAHIRMNDRTDADGKRVLFVEEIQSDWGQEGKKKGFVPKDIEAQLKAGEKRMAARGEEIRRISQRMADLTDDQLDEFNALADERQRLQDEQGKEIDWGNSLYDARASGVPAAPFVTKTEGWLNLALKRVMIMAAEGGYDRVAFVNGEQSAERYDLRKQISSITYEKDPQGKVYLDAKKLDGDYALQRDGLSMSEVEDLVGKEIAKKIDADEGEFNVAAGRMELSGLDLKVGGEGMKAFYDTIVPTALKKLLPKVGGGQMSSVSLTGNKDLRMVRDDDGTYAIEERRLDEYEAPYYEPIAYNLTKEQAQQKLREDARAQQPGFDVTPAMREKVAEGVPLFRRAPAEKPARFQTAPQQPLTAQQALDELRNQPVQQRTLRSMINGAFGGPGQGASGSDNQYVISTTAKLRTRLSDKAATVFEALDDAVTRGMISAMSAKSTQVAFKQSEASDQITPEFMRRGAIARDEVGGWRAEQVEGIRAPVEVFGIIENWGKARGLTMEQAWTDAARLMESGRQYVFREHNRSAKPGEPRLPVSMTDAQIDALYPAYKADATLLEAKKILDNARIRLIDQMVEVGRLSKDMAAEWKAAAEYIPFDRLSDEALGRYEAAFRAQKRTGAGLSALGSLPTLVDKAWVDRPVGNTLENYFGTLGWMQRQVMRTDALNKTLEQLKSIGQADKAGRTPPAGTPYVKTYQGGYPVYYKVPTIYHAFAFNAQVAPLPKYIQVLGQISRILRTSITALPTFTAAQLPQDIQRAITYSGVQNPAVLSAKVLANFKELVKHALKGTLSTATPDMSASGVIGDVDFRANDPARSLLEEFGYTSPTLLKSKTAGKILHRLNEISRASDIAIRKAIYEQTMEETGDRLLALQRAREIINFRTTGAGDPLNILPSMIQTIPFFNAYVQGTDVLYRALTGKGAVSGLARRQALKKFYTVAGTVVAGSTMYALMMAGDEEYEKMALDKRDRTWVLGGGFSIPVPSEIGMLFKAIPERVVDAYMKYGTPDEAAGMTAITSWFRAAAMEYGGRLNPIPAAARPPLEAWMNFSMRTGRELEGVYQEGLLPSYRTTGTTSELAKSVARFASDVLKLEVSPIKIDNTLNGYFGTTAALTLATMDAMTSDRADRPLHRIVGLTPFTYDPVGTRRIGEFYDMREKVVQAQNTLNALMKQNPEAAYRFAEKNADLLIVYKAVNATLKQLKDTRDYKSWLDTPAAAKQYSGEERLRLKQEVQKWEQDLVGWVRGARKDLNL